MAPYGDRIPDFFDFAVGTDQKCAAHDTLEDPSQEFFRTPHTVGPDHFVRGIADQRKIEFLLIAEIRQVLLGVGAGTQDGYVFLVETSFCVAKLGRFGGSTGGAGFGKEKEHHALALEFFQGDIRASVALQGEVWGSVSDF